MRKRYQIGAARSNRAVLAARSEDDIGGKKQARPKRRAATYVSANSSCRRGFCPAGAAPVLKRMGRGWGRLSSSYSTPPSVSSFPWCCASDPWPWCSSRGGLPARARAVEGLKRRRRTDSSGVSRARIPWSLASFAVCCPWEGAIVGFGPCDYILCLTTYRVYASETASLAH